MEKKKVAIVTLGDSRREFIKERSNCSKRDRKGEKRHLGINMTFISHLLYLTQKMDKIFLMRSRNRALKL